VLAACAVVLVLTMTLGVGVGSVPLSPVAVRRVVAGGLAGHPENSVAGIIVWQIRLPQVLLAAVVGAVLTTAGSVVQVLVRNALADPFLLGASSGASVGATAVLLLGAFASLAPTQLILCGVVLSALPPSGNRTTSIGSAIPGYSIVATGPHPRTVSKHQRRSCRRWGWAKMCALLPRAVMAFPFWLAGSDGSTIEPGTAPCSRLWRGE
jgi:hypothetical protein